MNEIMEKEMISIDDMIYEVRGVQVMLDSDLAELYQVETKRINEAVKNNPDKFPERFSFVLNNFEKKNLWSNFSTANISNSHVLILEFLLNKEFICLRLEKLLKWMLL